MIKSRVGDEVFARFALKTQVLHFQHGYLNIGGYRLPSNISHFLLQCFTMAITHIYLLCLRFIYPQQLNYDSLNFYFN